MTALQATRCPHCQTTFSITPAQQHPADNRVRCGACLQVFNVATATDAPNTKAAAFAHAVRISKRVTDRTCRAGPVQQFRNTDTPKQAKQIKKPSFIALPSNPGNHAPLPLLADLEKEPVQCTTTANKHWLRRWRQSAVILLLSLSLLWQYAWFNRATLAQDPDYRAFFAMIGALFGYTLPPLVAPQHIKSTALVVRQHPETAGALQVRTVIINEAAYPQPFPLVVLTFTDINGHTIGSRQLTPADYLPDALRGTHTMPVRQPIRLELAIIDPGQQAVNYALTLGPGRIP